MSGSQTIRQRLDLMETCKKIIFNSEWSKQRFLDNLDYKYKTSSKLLVIKQSIDRPKIQISKKENIITFVGKLNSAKGYDLFGASILKRDH